METAGTALRPIELTVEFETEPINVEPDRPRFSWRVEREGGGGRQQAYRLIVGRSRESIVNRQGECWDSGRVLSSRSTGVDYAGAALSSDTTYHWAVRVWNGEGEPTKWSDPAEFSTAFERGTKWGGNWISHPPSGGDRNGFRTPFRSEQAEEWVQLDLGESHRIEAVELYPTNPIGGPKTPDGAVVSPVYAHGEFPHSTVTATGAAGFGFPEAYRIEVSDEAEFATSTVVAEEDPENPGETPQRCEVGVRARYVRVIATDLYQFDPRDTEQLPGPQTKHALVRERHREWYTFALGGIAVRGADTEDLSCGGRVSASASVENERWEISALTEARYHSSTATESPWLRTEFDLEKPVQRARAHVAGLGYHELYVNDGRVGDVVLDPGWTAYDEHVLYRTYDLDDGFEVGPNAIGLWLGRGWFSKNFYDWTGGGAPRAKVLLTITYEDGTTQQISSGQDWRGRESPIIENDLFDGETYDARREEPGWAAPGFDDRHWRQVGVVDPPGGVLTPQRIEPIRIVETREPEEIRSDGEAHLVDFGQNLSGWCAIDVGDVAGGERIQLAHAEALTEEGKLATEDLRSATATDTFIAGPGERETYEPRFTYHGFRYARVTGYPRTLRSEDISARVVTTDSAQIGSFACSNAELNRVQQNCAWSMLGNHHSVPTDCPQRDERFGWTGDGRWTARPRILNFDMRRSFEKWSVDHDDVQSTHGYLADTVPYGLGTIPEDPSWALTRVSVPWMLYRYYGDRTVLETHFEGMQRYVDFWMDVAVDGLVPKEYANYGDWLAFEHTDGNRGLPLELFSTASLIQAIDLFSKAAEVLGYTDIANDYRERYYSFVDRFNREYLDEEAGIYGPGTQGSLAVPLSLDIVPERHVDAVVDALVRAVEDAGNRLRTGFLSTPALLETLSDCGHHELAYAIVEQPDKPGWVYMVRQGATTLWEHWDSDEQIGSGMNSLNHPSFACVSAWFIEWLAGLRIQNGGDHLVLDPGVVDALEWVEASIEMPDGEASLRWERDDETLRVEVTVPWNTTATLRVPHGWDPATVRESGETIVRDGSAVDPSPEVSEIDADENVRIQLDAGTYHFEITRRNSE